MLRLVNFPFKKLLVSLLIIGLGINAQADRLSSLSIPSDGQAGFTRLPPTQTGIQFTNMLSDQRAATNRNLLSGSGVAAGDVDGDGWCDLYFCALDNSNVLYLNRGNWKFEDGTIKAGVACEGWDCTGAAFADVEGDGDLDLLVNTLDRGTHLFLNDGKGKFTENQQAGLSSSNAATSMALADMDADGDLDLYVTHFRATTIRDRPRTKFQVEHVRKVPVVTHVDGRPATEPDLTNRFAILRESGKVEEFGEVDALYENDSSGNFKLIPFTGGRFLDENFNLLTEPPRDWGLAVQFRDFTGDGAPDLYICNDYFTPDRMWINTGTRGFRLAPPMTVRRTSLSSMGVDFADINHDGFADFYVVDMFGRSHQDQQTQVGDLVPIVSHPGEILNCPQIPQNTLQLNRGDGTFSEIAMLSGVQASEWSWCPVFLDVDLDGWEDILVSNGHRRDFQNADATMRIQEELARGRASVSNPASIMELFPPLHVTKAAFRNNRDLTFRDLSGEWGFSSHEISHGIALADLDNDGDMDVVMNNLGTAAGIYRNDCAVPRVRVRLTSTSRNTAGVGARVSLIGEKFTQTQEIICGGRYLSGGSMERTFAVAGQNELRLEVSFRTGEKRVIPSVRANHAYEIE